jgi:hypothetical protein
MSDYNKQIAASSRQVKDAERKANEANIDIESKKADLCMLFTVFVSPFLKFINTAEAESSLKNLTAEIDADTVKSIQDDIAMAEQWVSVAPSLAFGPTFV